MSNKFYDVIKWIALTGLPALITFYGVVGATLHIPYTQEVITIATAFDTMLGIWIGVLSSNYNKLNSENSKKEGK
jgi:hypothetical protein